MSKLVFANAEDEHEEVNKHKNPGSALRNLCLNEMQSSFGHKMARTDDGQFPILGHGRSN